MKNKTTNRVFFGLVVGIAVVVAAQRFAGKPTGVNAVTAGTGSVLVFGDDGVDASALGARLGRAVVDGTKSGEPRETAAAAAARVERALAAALPRPTLVVVSLGLGDLEARTALEETLRPLATVFQKIAVTGARVVFVPPLPPKDVGDNWLMALEDECRRSGVVWVGTKGSAKSDERVAKVLGK